MTKQEAIEAKVKKINELLEKNEVTMIENYFEDIYQDKYTNEIFRAKSQRFFESQEDADSVLEEILSKLIQFESSNK